jgi:N-methylhydantoinase A
VSAAMLEQAKRDFFAQHRRLYGYATEDEPTEIVNLGLTAVGAIRRPVLRKFKKGSANASAAVKEKRKVYFAGAGSKTCLIYDRYKLKHGNRIAGPAIVEEYDSTVVIYPRYFAEVDVWGNLLIQEKP